MSTVTTRGLQMDTIIYYIKAAAIIARHPVNVLTHKKAGFILAQIAKRNFRLHWLRDVAHGIS
jgi:hypothetical protein